MNKEIQMKSHDIHGKTYRRTLIMILILMATFAGTIMQTSMGTALPTLMSKFNINLNTAQQSTTWFLLANGIMIPLSAFLANRFSTKWLHVFAYGLFIVGILVTLSTPEKSSYWHLFILGRIIAASATGIMMPLMQMVIVNMFPHDKLGFALGLSGLVIGMGPAIGPTLSGWILNKNHYIFGLTITNSWRTIFILPLIIVVIAFLLAIVLMKDIIPNKKQKLDLVSLLLSTLGFGVFLLGFTNVATYGWTNFKNVLLFIFVGTIMLIWFILRQLHLKEPFLDLKVFKSRDFTVATIAIILVTMAMYGVEMMLPTYLQNIHHLSPLNSGLTLLAGALMIGLMAPVAGLLYNRAGIRRLTFVGFIILMLGTLPFMFLTDTTPTIIITILYAIRMTGVALAMMPLTTSAMNALPTEKSSDGTAANNTLRQISSSIVVAVLTSTTQSIINNQTPSTQLKTTDPILYAHKLIDATMNGFKSSFTLGFIFAFIGLLFVVFLKDEKKEVSDK